MNIFMLLDAPINLDALVFKSQFVSDWHITFTTDVSILPFFFFQFSWGIFFVYFTAGLWISIHWMADNSNSKTNSSGFKETNDLKQVENYLNDTESVRMKILAFSPPFYYTIITHNSMLSLCLFKTEKIYNVQ